MDQRETAENLKKAAKKENEGILHHRQIIRPLMSPMIKAAKRH